MSRSCCGVAELNGVIKSCEGFGALVNRSNYKLAAYYAIWRGIYK